MNAILKPKQFTLDEQMEEVMREIYMRERLYPAFVTSRRLTATLADKRIATMRAVLETLRAVKAQADDGK
jgi:hypothetical protein